MRRIRLGFSLFAKSYFLSFQSLKKIFPGEIPSLKMDFSQLFETDLNAWYETLAAIARAEEKYKITNNSESIYFSFENQY